MAKITTLQKLKLKADGSARMPSLKRISRMLSEYNIPHTITESFNNVEYKTKGRHYVNNRHIGRHGYLLCIYGTKICLNTSSSYYSFDSKGYAQEIVEYLNEKNIK